MKKTPLGCAKLHQHQGHYRTPIGCQLHSHIVAQWQITIEQTELLRPIYQGSYVEWVRHSAPKRLTDTESPQ